MKNAIRDDGEHSNLDEIQWESECKLRDFAMENTQFANTWILQKFFIQEQNSRVCSQEGNWFSLGERRFQVPYWRSFDTLSLVSLSDFFTFIIGLPLFLQVFKFQQPTIFLLSVVYLPCNYPHENKGAISYYFSHACYRTGLYGYELI